MKPSLPLQACSLGLLVVLSIATTGLAAEYKRSDLPLAEGMTRFSVYTDLGKGHFFEVNGVVLDPTAFRLDVVYVPDMLARMEASPIQIPRTVYEEKKAGHSRSLPTLSSLAASAVPDVVINGGFRQGSWSHVVPAGLLAIDGLLVQPINRRSRVQTGVLCIAASPSDGDPVRLSPVSEFDVEGCGDAMQSGPFIVDPGGKIGISEEEIDSSMAYRRSFVCLRASGEIVLAVTTEAHLRSLAEMLTDPSEDAGFQCERALNLSGDVESGLLIKDPQSQDYEGFGEVDVAIASALIVRRQESQTIAKLSKDDAFLKDGRDFFFNMIKRASDLVGDPAIAREEKDAALLEISLQSFDIDHIVSFVLARSISEFSAEGLEEFKRLYARWLIQRYVSSLYGETNTIADVAETNAYRADQENLVLETEITLSDSRSTKVNVDWVLGKEDDFKVEDVRVEGFSMVATHRRDFAEILYKEGPEGLVARLESEPPPVSALK